MQHEKIVRAAMFVAKIRDSSPEDHQERLMYAKKLRDLVDDFIFEEVKAANSKGKGDKNYMSWDKIGQVMDLSRSAAFTRYGAKRDR